MAERHTTALEPGQFWACTRPEAMVEDGIMWDEECPACVLAYKGAQVSDPNAKVFLPDGRTVLVRDFDIGSEEWMEAARST